MCLSFAESARPGNAAAERARNFRRVSIMALIITGSDQKCQLPVTYSQAEIRRRRDSAPAQATYSIGRVELRSCTAAAADNPLIISARAHLLWNSSGLE